MQLYCTTSDAIIQAWKEGVLVSTEELITNSSVAEEGLAYTITLAAPCQAGSHGPLQFTVASLHFHISVSGEVVEQVHSSFFTALILP